MTPEQLQSVYAKISWARGHFHLLDAEITAWLHDDTHRIIYERNEDLTQHYLRAEFGSKPRIDRWPLILGDCLTNLRDALDHSSMPLPIFLEVLSRKKLTRLLSL